ncbi:MAG: transposase [Cyanobacteria bacterium P01_C01_bin.120]
MNLSPRPKGRKPSRNAPPFDLRTHLYRISGVNFTQIDGLEALTVQTILSEVGLDPTRFPSVKHFVSWLGLCPGSPISNSKVLSSKTRKVNNRAVTAFRIAAHSLATRKLTSESGHPHR